MPEGVFVVPRSQFKGGYEFQAWTEIKRKLSLTRNLAFFPAHRKDFFGTMSIHSISLMLSLSFSTPLVSGTCKCFSHLLDVHQPVNIYLSRFNSFSSRLHQIVEIVQINLILGGAHNQRDLKLEVWMYLSTRIATFKVNPTSPHANRHPNVSGSIAAERSRRLRIKVCPLPRNSSSLAINLTNAISLSTG